LRNHIGDYFTCVSELTKLEEIQRLDGFTQHFNTSRLEHCVNVSYFSYKICKRLGWDYRSAARAGLMHDLYLYDRHTEKHPQGRHVYVHAKVALKNARKITSLNKIEADAILKHMWPMTMRLPRYKESYIVNFVDTICAVCEFTTQTKYYIKKTLSPSVVRAPLQAGKA